MSVRSTFTTVHLVLVALGGFAMIGHSIERYVRATQTPTVSADQLENERVRAEISHYREWKLVNPTPQRMDPVISASCARVLRPDQGSPHFGKYISVYVNSVGADAMLTKREPVFPEGSIIVKEKLPNATSKEPELLTVMRKREKGFNPASGDWEYLILDGNAANITERGKIETCNACHTAYKSTDYITRAYLPNEVLKGLR